VFWLLFLESPSELAVKLRKSLINRKKEAMFPGVFLKGVQYEGKQV
jgi:hypothetical protein